MIILDLHEYTIQEAYEETLDFVIECHEERIKKAKVITGKGEIGREFPMWLDRNPIVRKIEQTNDGGCYHIWIAISQRRENEDDLY
tara:strand:+ start:193 stop:450 length:258 start_codon:yes stop_codon:yes gene_type:complete